MLSSFAFGNALRTASENKENTMKYQKKTNKMLAPIPALNSSLTFQNNKKVQASEFPFFSSESEKTELFRARVC